MGIPVRKVLVVLAANETSHTQGEEPGHEVRQVEEPVQQDRLGPGEAREEQAEERHAGVPRRGDDQIATFHRSPSSSSGEHRIALDPGGPAIMPHSTRDRPSGNAGASAPARGGYDPRHRDDRRETRRAHRSRRCPG
jgi:hypothetical protein